MRYSKDSYDQIEKMKLNISIAAICASVIMSAGIPDQSAEIVGDERSAPWSSLERGSKVSTGPCGVVFFNNGPVVAAIAEMAMAADTSPLPGRPVTRTTAGWKAGAALATVPNPSSAATFDIGRLGKRAANRLAEPRYSPTRRRF